jgi:hypothetical protein
VEIKITNVEGTFLDVAIMVASGEGGAASFFEYVVKDR